MMIPSAFTQYCDDVRREADGRSSLMGVYPGSAEIALDEQQKLPKICAHTLITIPPGYPLTSILVISIWRGKEVGKVEIPDSAVEEFNRQQSTPSKNTRSLVLTTVIEVRDLEIDAGGTLRTNVNVNGDEISARKLYLGPLAASE